LKILQTLEEIRRWVLRLFC